MNTIDYYREYLSKLHIKLINWLPFNDASFNKYLYILEDKLIGPVTISTTMNGLNEYYIEDIIKASYGNTYIIFIPYNEYTFVLMYTVNDYCIRFNFYNDKMLFMCNLTLNQLELFVDWLQMDSLQEKILKALDYILINLRIIDDFSMHKDDTVEYKSEYNTKIDKAIDCFISGLYPRALHYVVNIYDNAYKQLYVDIVDNHCVTSNEKMNNEHIAIEIYCFRIDNDRYMFYTSWMNKKIMIGLYYKGKLIHIASDSNNNFKMLCMLISRNDLIEKVIH